MPAERPRRRPSAGASKGRIILWATAAVAAACIVILTLSGGQPSGTTESEGLTQYTDPGAIGGAKVRGQGRGGGSEGAHTSGVVQPPPSGSSLGSVVKLRHAPPDEIRAMARAESSDAAECTTKNSKLPSKDSGGMQRTRLPERLIPACAEDRAGVVCIPKDCNEAAARPRALSGETSSPAGAEVFPPWVTLPSCETLERCPSMQGWPAHLASRCQSGTLLTHCLSQLPPPADPATVPHVAITYEPSRLEEEYLQVVRSEYNDQPQTVCEVQNRYAKDMETWVVRSEASWSNQASLSLASGPMTDKDGVFSVMRSRVQKANGETVESARLIEPLVGLMRHPWAGAADGHSFCESAGQPRSLFDWRYVALESADDPTFALRYPGRKVFIDLGATTFGDRPRESRDTSTGDARTYEDMFGDAGIKFDLKLGWEAQADKFGASAFFESIMKFDASLASRTCQALRPAQPEDGHLDNALELLAQLWRPGDYFVFKLDIDTPEVEDAFMRIVENRCPHIVAELIYEEHCNVPELIGCCWLSLNGEKDILYGRSLRRFQKLRKLGIRTHFWV